MAAPINSFGFNQNNYAVNSSQEECEKISELEREIESLKKDLENIRKNMCPGRNVFHDPQYMDVYEKISEKTQQLRKLKGEY